MPFKKGNVPWNKELTKYTDSRIEEYGLKLKGKKSEAHKKKLVDKWKDPEIRTKRSIGLKEAWKVGKLEGRLPYGGGAKGKKRKLETISKQVNTLTQRHKKFGLSEAEKNRGIKISKTLTKMRRFPKMEKYCKCECWGVIIPSSRGNYPDFIHGHNPNGKKGKSKYPDIPLDLQVYCKTCGKRLEIKPHHRYQGVPRYCHGHNPDTGFWRRQQPGSKLSPKAYEKRIEKLVKTGYSNNCKTYHYYSEKNQKQIFYHSKYELQAFQILEQMSVVKSYERCKYVVDYEYEGNLHKYIPDFLITYDDGRQEVIEVKPEYQLKYDRNKAKIDAAQNYFGKLDIPFNIWTETKLFN